jgi:hypothetical protein
MQPTWLADVLATAMVTTAVYCVARLVAAQRWKRALHRVTNVAHAADGLAMAGMLVGSLKTLPDGVWEVVFGTFSLWFALRAARFLLRNGLGAMDGEHTHTLAHYVSHLTMSGAMLYMFVEAAPARSVPNATDVMAMGGAGGTSNLTALTLLLIVILFASAVWHGDGLSRYTTIGRGPSGVRVSGGPEPQWVGEGPGAALAAGTFGLHPPHTSAGGPLRLAPRLEMLCHMALCITMGYMLVLML